MNLAKDAYKGQQSFKRMSNRAMTGDGYQNMMAKLGINAANLSSGGRYDFGAFITRQRLMLEAAYRTSWIIGQVVDVVAEDMTREGLDINSELPPDDTDMIQQSLVKMGIWEQITNGIKWGRLYGGAAGIILIEGQDMSTPLDVSTVGRDSFKGLFILDRWLLYPSLGNLIPDYGPDFQMPMYYDVVTLNNPNFGSFRESTPQMNKDFASQRIHYSRIIRFDGIELPYIWKQAENMWSESVCERMWDRLLAFDSVTQGAAQLVFKAHLRTVNVDGLRSILAAGGVMEAALLKQFEYIRMFQSNEGITLLDAKDQFATHQYSFSGLSDLILQFGQQISGSTGIPLARLFGQSPSGMNATGDMDIRNYYDKIAQLQVRQLHRSMLKLISVMSLSTLGKELPENTTIKFRPLWQMSDKEKSEITTSDTQSIQTMFNAGIITKVIALKELKQQSALTGRFTNITDEDLAEAEKAPELPMGEMPLMPPFEEKGNGIKAKVKDAIRMFKDSLNRIVRRAA